MEFDLKWVHVALYELILRLDGALWLTIIFRPLLTPKRADNASFGQWEAHEQNPLHQQKARAHMLLQRPTYHMRVSNTVAFTQNDTMWK